MEDSGGIQFQIPGEPIGKGRPRFVRATGRAFTPQRTRTYEAVVKDYAERAMGGRPPFEGPLEVTIEASFLHPQSWSEKKKNRARWKTSKPDADNILKICDSMNKVVWKDDAQVAVVKLAKFYASTASLRIRVEPLA